MNETISNFKIQFQNQHTMLKVSKYHFLLNICLTILKLFLIMKIKMCCMDVLIKMILKPFISILKYFFYSKFGIFIYFIEFYPIHMININQTKESMASSMLQNKRLEQPGSVLWQTDLYDQKQPKKILIFQRGIQEVNTFTQEIKSFYFQFNVIFKPNFEPPSITFQKEYDQITYLLPDNQQLTAWRQILKRKLNQRGFHESFKPLNKIGKGNFGTVFTATKIEENNIYAVKAFCKQVAYSEQNGKECIIKEIDFLRSLDHRNIIRLHQIFQTQNSLYLIFDYLQGGNLQEYFQKERRFTQIEIQQIMRGILMGLRQMHSLDIMHRDLKPDNILFRKKGSNDVVIADFGLAEKANCQQYLFVRCGTPGFVAPQVINIKDLSTKYEVSCDIFSLGLLFHILLVGKSIFPSQTYNNVLKQNRLCEFNFSSSLYKNVSSDAMDLLQSLLDKNPQTRINAQLALKHRYLAKQNARNSKTALKEYKQYNNFIKSQRNKQESNQITMPADNIEADEVKKKIFGFCFIQRHQIDKKENFQHCNPEQIIQMRS